MSLINNAQTLLADVRDEIDEMFEYHTWDLGQQLAGAEVREALKRAVEALVQHVPPCPDRSTAIRKLREARMDANSAITHRGKY